MASYKILSVEMNGETYKVGDTVWHVDGSYGEKIYGFASGRHKMGFFADQHENSVRDLNNFRLAGKGIRAQIIDNDKATEGIRAAIQDPRGKFVGGPMPTKEDFEEMMKMMATEDEELNEALNEPSFKRIDNPYGDGGHIWQFRIGNLFGFCGDKGKEVFENEMRNKFNQP